MYGQEGAASAAGGVSAGDGTGPSLTAALNWDALEEVFVHCSLRDLLALRSTCRTTCELLGRSEKVWQAKLRESFGLHLRQIQSMGSSGDGVLMRLARCVFEASRTQALRFQGVFVAGGVDEDAMHYFVDNMFRGDKAPYCSNCSHDADCVALLLDGEVPRDAEFARVRQYMVRRCRYAAALIMNVQVPEHGRDPDDIMHILEDWTDMQLEGFFRDLVGAMQAEHALGRLLVFDIPHDRLEAEEQKILGVHQWLLDRPKLMKAAMLKAPEDGNAMLDSSVMPKLTAGAGGDAGRRLAGVIHEVSVSRAGNLTCPVAAGAVVVGCLDHSKVAGWPAEDVLALLREAARAPACTALNGLHDAAEVAAAADAGLLPPIVATDEALAGVWHEFDTGDGAAARQAAAAAAAAGSSTAAQLAARRQHAQRCVAGPEGAPLSPVAAADADGTGPSGSKPRLATAADVITWRPLLWFKFHTKEEAQSFLHRHRPLIELHGSQATVRHRGPAPTRRGHVAHDSVARLAAQRGQGQAQSPAAALAATLAAAVQGQQQAQQVQQHGAPQQQQGGGAPQPVPAGQVAVGVPLPGPGEAPGDLPGGAAGGGAEAAVLPQGQLQAEDDWEDASEGDTDDGGQDDLSDESDGSDEEGEEQGWLNNFLQDEFGLDLQEQEQDMVVAGEGLAFDHMDEGESSEEEELDAEAGEHFDLAGAGGAQGQVPGVAAAGGAGPAAQNAPVVQASPAETLLRALSQQNTRARNRLRIPLSRSVGANIVLVKLIDQENLMHEYGDPHDWPNIDCTCVGLTGKLVELPPGVVL